jgi:hypothetical protein
MENEHYWFRRKKLAIKYNFVFSTTLHFLFKIMTSLLKYMLENTGSKMCSYYFIGNR